MASSTRFSSSLERRSIFARIAALLALVACGVAIYLVVMSFSSEDGDAGSKQDGKGRSEQRKGQSSDSEAESYTVVAGDTLSGIAAKTGVPEPRLERLNPELDAETVNAGQVLVLH
jgi:LysM repeat protein